MNWVLSLTPSAAPDPLSVIAGPPALATILELRCDLFPDVDLASAVSSCPLPVLATLRSQPEGGQATPDPQLRSAFFQMARDAGAALIDVEFDRDLEVMRKLGIPPERTVLSKHYCSQTPDDLEQSCRDMLVVPAAITKCVTTASCLDDLKRVLAVTRTLNPKKRSHRRLVCFAMGPVGIPTRLLSPLLGPALGFAALTEGEPSAPGQLPIADIDAIVGHLSAPPRALFAVVGSDVSRSLSPRLHAAGYRARDLPNLMVPLSIPDPAELEKAFSLGGLEEIFGIPVRGLAVTAPYKARAHDAADLRSPRCAHARAANTLILDQQGIRADNTDADGIVTALTDLDIELEGVPAVIAGTGGAARGVAVGLANAGARVYLRGRDAQQNSMIAAQLGVNALDPDELCDEPGILINATPLGSQAEDQHPFQEEEMAIAGAIVDMVYSNLTTRLISEAEDADIPHIDGRTMLAHQAFPQFAAMNSCLPPRREMLDEIVQPTG